METETEMDTKHTQTNTRSPVCSHTHRSILVGYTSMFSLAWTHNQDTHTHTRMYCICIPKHPGMSYIQDSISCTQNGISCIKDRISCIKDEISCIKDIDPRSSKSIMLCMCIWSGARYVVCVLGVVCVVCCVCVGWCVCGMCIWSGARYARIRWPSHSYRIFPSHPGRAAGLGWLGLVKGRFGSVRCFYTLT